MPNGQTDITQQSSSTGERVPERLLDSKVDEDGEKYYLVKWSGLPREENSWESRSSLSCYLMMDRFEARIAREGTIGVSLKRRHRYRRRRYVPFQQRITGFDSGRTPEMVLGMTDISGELEFLIKWEGVCEADWIPREIANIRCPEIVIRYYEENMVWKNPPISEE